MGQRATTLLVPTRCRAVRGEMSWRVFVCVKKEQPAQSVKNFAVDERVESVVMPRSQSSLKKVTSQKWSICNLEIEIILSSHRRSTMSVNEWVRPWSQFRCRLLLTYSARRMICQPDGGSDSASKRHLTWETNRSVVADTSIFRTRSYCWMTKLKSL